MDSEPTDFAMVCAVCDGENTHIERVVTLDDHDGCQPDCVRIEVSCEDGHRFELHFQQHKGRTFVRSVEIEQPQEYDELGGHMGNVNPDRTRGLYHKFHVSRTDQSPAHLDCDYYVLDMDHDPHALAAIRAYIQSCEKDFPILAADLRIKEAQMELRFKRPEATE